MQRSRPLPNAKAQIARALPLQPEFFVKEKQIPFEKHAGKCEADDFRWAIQLLKRSGGALAGARASTPETMRGSPPSKAEFSVTSRLPLLRILLNALRLSGT